MPINVTNIVPPSNNPLPATLRCDVAFPVHGTPSVVFLLLDEGNNDAQADRLVASLVSGSWEAHINAGKLTNGRHYTVVVVAKLTDAGGNIIDTGAGASARCIKNP